MSWGNTYSTTLKQLNTKQNNCIRSTFFINNRESALPYYQLLDILKLENIVKLKTSILTHKLFTNNPMSVPSLFHEFYYLLQMSIVIILSMQLDITFIDKKLGLILENLLLNTLLRYYGKVYLFASNN